MAESLPRQSDVDTPVADAPSSFAELNGGGKLTGPVCRFCGEPATHRVQIVARQKGIGRGRRGGANQQDANHSQDYCEVHAVELFLKVRKAMR